LVAGPATAALVLLAFEQPRSRSPRGYLAQLRARFLELQCIVDGAEQSCAGEGKENGDEVDVESKP
jgi:hypothetical protein